MLAGISWVMGGGRTAGELASEAISERPAALLVPGLAPEGAG